VLRGSWGPNTALVGGGAAIPVPAVNEETVTVFIAGATPGMQLRLSDEVRANYGVGESSGGVRGSFGPVLAIV